MKKFVPHCSRIIKNMTSGLCSINPFKILYIHPSKLIRLGGKKIENGIEYIENDAGYFCGLTLFSRYSRSFILLIIKRLYSATEICKCHKYYTNMKYPTWYLGPGSHISHDLGTAQVKFAGSKEIVLIFMVNALPTHKLLSKYHRKG